MVPLELVRLAPASGEASGLLQRLSCFLARSASIPHVTDLLILGASARAAAYSAIRAGFTPIAIDRFADRDLSLHATALRIPPDDYPEGLVQIAAATAVCPWMYTGALENRPDLIGRLSQARPLWGNGPQVLHAVRSPIALVEALRSAGLPAVEVSLDPSTIPRDGSWLRKPLASAGGYGIVPFDPFSPVIRASYYQRFIEGENLSAVFVGTRTGAPLLGITRQLLGRPASPFAYRGSIAPWEVSARILTRIQDLGEFVARRFHLVGLFGIDFVSNGDDPWAIEVNPRYTASVETIDHASGRALLAYHQAACEGASLPTERRVSRSTFVGKEIVFADRKGIFDVPEASIPICDAFQIPTIADIPPTGSQFRAGEPILTVFAEAETGEDCLLKLHEARSCWLKKLGQNEVF
jgi:predicted ATP-grasp superfamily ATP-dependent carboligase